MMWKKPRALDFAKASPQQRTLATEHQSGRGHRGISSHASGVVGRVRGIDKALDDACDGWLHHGFCGTLGQSSPGFKNPRGPLTAHPEKVMDHLFGAKPAVSESLSESRLGPSSLGLGNAVAH